MTGKLSWTHYCELLSISDKDKRSFYEKEAMNSNWSVRELKRQTNTSLYERLLLSKGDINKQEVLKLAAKGIITKAVVLSANQIRIIFDNNMEMEQELPGE